MEEQDFPLKIVLFLLSVIPATSLTALLASLPERTFVRAAKTGALIFLSWLFFTVLRSNITNFTVALSLYIANIFVIVSIFEMTYKTTFKRGLGAVLLFWFCLGVLMTLLGTIITAMVLSYFLFPIL